MNSKVLGHQGVEQMFTKALQKGHLHHAWLLYGMKGIGKDVLAEKLAAYLMCDTQSACGVCHGCQMLKAGSHPDVFRAGLIEGKRDLNIEQVRGVLAFLALSGAESGRRVVILDDAERMNGQAANALLKGLEEPTEGSMLLMVCADLERLPATIRSRCMLQQCSPLCDQDVRLVLQKLNPPVEDRYLDLAVSVAGGSPGAVACLQDRKIADAMLEWQALVADMARADVGKIDNWIRNHLKTVPHGLIVQMMTNAAYPVLQTPCLDADAFSRHESIQQALHLCARWPADVVRHSLRAGPALLACILQLRTALKA
ncbi:AAA family ATPase [Mariprofundus sp. EBB-1]|uniref:DNA polymerase III subunit n=1 Tax=Mariprofundus sp. EBB-1 TaxID=2650971 RepID=UPI000EF1A783|nr:DNA polymerase III subunit [Mariprofundus sp. EBB-1]RLL53699.1 AAA family ATPase [Mariprofundus sp. EBB-1]